MDINEINKAQALITEYKKEFDDDCDRFLPLTEPALTKAGKIRVHQPYIAKREKVWWQAQCAFRGLKTDGTVAVLQDRIRGRNKQKDNDVSRIHSVCKEATTKAAREAYEQRKVSWVNIDRDTSEREPVNSGRPARTKKTARKSVRPRPAIQFNPTADGSSSKDEEYYTDEHLSERQPVNSSRPPRTKQTARKSVRPRSAIQLNPMADGSSSEEEECSMDEHVSDPPEPPHQPRQTARKQAPSRSTTATTRIEKTSKDADWDITGYWEIDCEDLSEFLSGPVAD